MVLEEVCGWREEDAQPQNKLLPKEVGTQQGVDVQPLEVSLKVVVARRDSAEARREDLDGLRLKEVRARREDAPPKAHRRWGEGGRPEKVLIHRKKLSMKLEDIRRWEVQ